MKHQDQPRILVSGRNGQVSWELRRSLQTLGEIVALGRQDWDLARPQEIRDRIQEIKPTIIVNAAAYTAVDRAETERAVARSLNVDAPAVMAEEARKCGAFMLHYSTDYVFDGRSETPYDESDQTNPQSVYGATKLEGELAVAASGASHLVLRTSWVYGDRGRNFLLTILSLARERSDLAIVDDQFGAPTWSRSIAEATAQILAGLHGGHGDWGDDKRLNRVYHLSSAGKTSWYGFAQAFLDLVRKRGDDLALQRLSPISTAEYPTAAVRPPCSLLSNHAIGREFGVFIPPWDAALALLLDSDYAR